MPQNQTFGQRVHERRKQLDLRQDALAEACEITQSNLSKIESNTTTQLKTETIVRIAKALKTTTDSLLGMESGKQTDPLRDDKNLQKLIVLYPKMRVRDAILVLRLADLLASRVKDVSGLSTAFTRLRNYVQRSRAAHTWDETDPDYLAADEYMATWAIELALESSEPDDSPAAS